MADARALAVEALTRIDDGAYANLVLPPLLARSGLSAQDRGFVTELVYGTTRMQRACDWLVDRFLIKPPDRVTRAVLRLGAYQLIFLRVPPHAAVSATVDVAPLAKRGLVNAILRRVAAAPDVEWPDEGVRLSYPDWIIARLIEDLGRDEAMAALETMNRAPEVTVRPDGYVQDRASQWVAELVAAASGEVGLDLCAAPGGKASWIVRSGATRVVAADLNPTRLALNRERLGPLVAADGAAPPFGEGTFDWILVDAPCSGLGVLRRRPDARWRIGPGDVDDLVKLQRRLVTAAVPLLKPGGRLVYSVCTLTAAETTGVDEWLAGAQPGLAPADRPPAPWEPLGRGARLLPQRAGTDGMYLLRLRRADP